MKAYIIVWLLLTAIGTGIAQPVSLVAIEDLQFETQFTQRTIPQVLHITFKK